MIGTSLSRRELQSLISTLNTSCRVAHWPPSEVVCCAATFIKLDSDKLKKDVEHVLPA